MSMTTKEGFLSKAINRKITRRSFLKWSAAIGATTTMSGLIANSAVKVAGAASQSGVTGTGGDINDWKVTRCLMCHSICYLAVGVTSAPADGQPAGVIRKVEGLGGQWKTGATTPTGSATSTWDALDDANYPTVGAGYLPYSLHNRGRVCAKGNNGLEHVYDPDRVKYPLERAGARGDGRWRRVSWEYALKKMANVLRELAGRNTFYDLNVDSDFSLYAYGTAGKVFQVNSPRGVDQRHRFIEFVGRNESNKGGAQFSTSYGTPNHIEHTSLCELSRHIAGRTFHGHHWSIPDLVTHKTFTLPAAYNPTGANYTVDSSNDCDLVMEIGGNPLEAKIPSASYSVKWGDSRRRHLVGANAAASSAKGRIIAIDVRQSNTMAFADEQFFITPGTDGALALAMFRYIGDEKGWATLGAQTAAGHKGKGGSLANRQYFGLFMSEEGTGAGDVPSGKSLESYVRNAGAGNFASDVGAASNSLADVMTAVSNLTGLSVTNIGYLARALAGMGSGTDSLSNTYTMPAYKNAILDGYRGPAKHSNGCYNYRAIRALNIVAANKFSGDYAGAGASRPGAYDAPGAMILDGDTMSGTGSSGTGWTGTVPGGGTASTAIKSKRIDQWDYENGQERWRLVRTYKWNDQNLIPAIRYFYGVHPYKVNETVPATYKGPEKNPTGTWWNWSGEYESDYVPEAMLVWKNAPAFARANVGLDIDTFTTKWPAGHPKAGQYRLSHLWSIDCYMGDGTRFADLILPDTTYLERYDSKADDDFGMSLFKANAILRQPCVEDRTKKSVSDPTKYLPRHLYDTRSIRAITYELSRLIEPTSAGEAPWSGNMYGSYDWVNAFHGTGATSRSSSPDYANDGEYAAQIWARIQCGGIATTNAAFPTGWDWMQNMGASFWPDGNAVGGAGSTSISRPTYFKDSHDSNQGTSTDGGSYRSSTLGGGKLQVYNDILRQVVDINGVTFSGTPKYVPVAQKTSSAYPLHLTTYKLNLHTQSRTAANPRQQEIIGYNWAMIHPTTAATYGIANGDKVRVTSEQGSLEIEAKVTPKAQPGCVHISHHQGHDAASFGGDGAGGMNGYQVTEDGVTYKANRQQSTYLNVPPTAIDVYRLANPPSAPSYNMSRGTNSNQVITRWTATAGQSTDPVGVSMAWFDTKVKVEKV